MTAAHELGRHGEELAHAHLVSTGYRILDRNWRCRHGEIDLIARDPETLDLVFVEVKARSSLAFGHPLEGISAAKYRRLRRLAGVWIDEVWSTDNPAPASIRIDAISVLLVRSAPPQLEHHRGVFR